MINVFQNEKEYTISVTIKKVNFSETPSKRDFKKFAEKVFEAYTNIIVEALEARMNACVNDSDDVKYYDSKYITYTRKSGGEHTFSYNAYDTVQRLVKKIQQYKLGELTKSELK